MCLNVKPIGNYVGIKEEYDVALSLTRANVSGATRAIPFTVGTEQDRIFWTHRGKGQRLLGSIVDYDNFKVTLRMALVSEGGEATIKLRLAVTRRDHHTDRHWLLRGSSHRSCAYAPPVVPRCRLDMSRRTQADPYHRSGATRRRTETVAVWLI
jgi:hypothetical protein